PAHAHPLPGRTGDVDEPGRRRGDRRPGQRLGGGGQPERGDRRPPGRLAPDARRDRVHLPRPGADGGHAAHRDHRQARRHPQLSDLAAGQAHPPHRRIRPVQLRLQLHRPDRQPARRDHRGPQAHERGEVLMAGTTGERPIGRVMAQVAMVMNLDKCIGCHTCSVTCKQAWTNRSGVEYVWFNNVETRPGQGYPRRYQDQDRWKGGWTRTRSGRLKPRAGGRIKKLATIFANPLMPAIEDYYEPWTYDYDHLISAPLGDDAPVARPRSLLTGEPMQVRWSANWDDDLAGGPELASQDPVVQRLGDQVRLEFEQTFMFYLPRICEHCLNPSCVASCPSGAMYKRSEDGIVLVDQDRCRGWRMCVTGCPYKKVYFNHKTGKSEK